LYLKPLILERYFDAVKLFCIRKPTGKIAGFLGVSDEKVEMLFIDASSHNEEIGRALMKFSIETLNIRKVDVNEQNEHAVAFYRKIGFHVVKRNPLDSLGKPYPILEMELES
jgi:putative acetyltransferase